MKQLFNHPQSERAQTLVSISFADLYKIVRTKLDYFHPDKSDPDAFCQDMCVRIEKAMGIFPNVEGLSSPAPQQWAFKPCISVNDEAKITTATFEDVAYVAVPVFDGVHHWIDKHLALDDGRMVGMAVWATLPPQGDVPAADELHAEIDRLRKALTLSDADRRLWFISDLLGKRLYFNRYEICEAFGVSIPQASIDIRRWMEKHPGAIKYNKSLKRYEAASPATPQEDA